MRYALHVRTIHSGKCAVPGFSRFCLESYNEPRALHEILKHRRMDLVTATDHDSIDAVEELRKYADFFFFVTVNRSCSGLTGRRTDEDFALFARDFHGVEVTNGRVLARANQLSAEFAVRHDKPATAGSDAYSPHGAGQTFTEISDVRNASELVTALRRGQGVPHGESGNCWKLTQAISSIGWSLVRTNRRAVVLSPLFAFVPLFSLVNYCRKHAFAWYWGQKNRTIEPESNSLSLRAVEL